MPYDYATLVKAITQSHSPNLAYRAAKELLADNPDERARLSKECLDVAWDDAKRFNRMVERLEGRLSRPQRRSAELETIESESQKIRLARKPHAELGRILAEYDIESIRAVYSSVHDWFIDRGGK